ncbi:MAG: SpoIIIAH-like family protein [Christensenellales bacterium]
MQCRRQRETALRQTKTSLKRSGRKRESTRLLEIEYLDEIIAASANDSETLKDATEQKLRLVANMEAEFSAESMIRAKGFSDAAVTFHKGSVNVVIAAEELSSEEVAQILDIVKRETGEKTENIKIMAGGN